MRWSCIALRVDVNPIFALSGRFEILGVGIRVSGSPRIGAVYRRIGAAAGSVTRVGLRNYLLCIVGICDWLRVGSS